MCVRATAINMLGKIAIPAQQLVSVAREALRTQVAIKLNASKPPDISAVFGTIILDMVHGQKGLFGHVATGTGTSSAVSRNHLGPQRVIARLVRCEACRSIGSVGLIPRPSASRLAHSAIARGSLAFTCLTCSTPRVTSGTSVTSRRKTWSCLAFRARECRHGACVLP